DERIPRGPERRQLVERQVRELMDEEHRAIEGECGYDQEGSATRWRRRSDTEDEGRPAGRGRQQHVGPVDAWVGLEPRRRNRPNRLVYRLWRGSRPGRHNRECHISIAIGARRRRDRAGDELPARETVRGAAVRD